MTPSLPRTLRARLTAGLVVLLAMACLAVGLTTVLALQAFMIERLDQQLAGVAGSFAASLEHEEPLDADDLIDSHGQARGTFGARIRDGEVTSAAVVNEAATNTVDLSERDRAVLVAVPADGRGHTVELSSLGQYRVVATDGFDGDVLITGLPLHPVEEVVERLRSIELGVFGLAIAVTGIAGALWVSLALRPLRRVAATATEVTALPLASGTVAMPDPVPDTDPRTEVGRVGLALNRMLAHVGEALARRQASEERLRRFAADASHELRTPVATVRAHAELALKHPDGLPEGTRHALERIQSESRRMGALVDDLLLLARLDAGRPLSREQVDLTRLVIDAADDARTAGPGHHWRLELPEEPVTVTGDEHRLHQVVANLLVNARAHTPPGTVVTVALTGEADSVTLTVTDDGPGIPESLLPEVFGRFTRADSGRSRAAGGTGLGLAIVAAVASAHGGSAEVTSRPGRTRFIIELPRGGLA
jgi:two-component system, OmpR family, sensor kinase